MTFTLEEIKKQFQNDAEFVNSEFQKIKETLFLNKPSIKKWSAAECIKHLNNGCKMYLPKIEEALSKSGNSNTGLVKISWIENKMIAILEPPYKLKMPTGGEFIPSGKVSKEKVLSDFQDYQNQFISLIDKYSDKDFTSTKFSSPAFSLFKLTPGFAFLFLAAHQRRHIWQAEQTLKSIPQSLT